MTIEEYAMKYDMTMLAAFNHAWHDTYRQPCRSAQTAIDLRRYYHTRVLPDYVSHFVNSRGTAILRARQRDLFRDE